MNAKIEVKEIPTLQFTGITHYGIKGIETVFQRLIHLGQSKGVFKNPETKVARIFHDSFKVTTEDKVRMTVCLLTPEIFPKEGAIHSTNIKKNKCIVGRFKIMPTEFEKAWSGLFIWMTKNGFVTAEENPFEIYHNDFRSNPPKKLIVDLHIPIQ